MPDKYIEILERFDEPALLPWATFLRDYKLRLDPERYVECHVSLAALKREAVQKDDQPLAKAIWCLETIAKAQEHYITAFQGLRSASFKEAWRNFSLAENEVVFLSDHFSDDELEFGIAFVQVHTKRFQDLFPVKWGMSPELIIKETRCSICDTILTLRNDCGHEQGEIYNGEVCHSVISDIDMIAVSLVENPVQKSTVIFPENIEILYPLQQIAQSLRSPWQAWNYYKEERRSHHPAFNLLGRNDECGCGSGIKYKRCCLGKETVFPHYNVYLLD